MSRTTEVDLDRLADYTAGVLDTQDRHRVEELLATDPEWRRAHAALRAAGPRLDAALAGLHAPALPAEVASRLDAALAGATGTGTGTVIDLSARRRRQRVAVGAVAAVAAAVVAFGGLVAVLHGGTGTKSNTSAGAGAVGAAPQLGTVGPAQRSSGTDYTRQNLSGVLNQAAEGSSESFHADAKAPALGTQESGGLSRLTAPDALGQCLAAVVARFGGNPVLVDYARFEGKPALIVVITGNGPQRIVVVGPTCGIGGAAELYDTTQ